VRPFERLAKGLPVLLTLWAVQVLAAPRALSVKDAVEATLANNPSLQSAREKVRQIDLTVSLTKSALFPSIAATATAYDKKDAVGIGSPQFGGDSYNQYITDVKATQPLFQIGSLSAISSAKKSRDLSHLDSVIAERDLIANVIAAYYQVVLNSKNVETLNRQQGIVDESLKTATHRERIGRGQRLDVLQAKTQAALMEAQVVAAKNQLQIATANLAYLMGGVKDDAFQIKPQLVAPDIAAVDRVVELKNYQIPELQKDEIALSQIDDLKRVTLGQDLPNLSLVGDYTYSSYRKDNLFDPLQNSWYIGLQLTIPLFSGFSSIHKQSQLSSQRTQLEFDKSNDQNSVVYQQIVSRKNLETAHASIVTGREALKLAIASSEEARRNFRLGTIDFLQFLTVEQAYVQAEQTLNANAYGYITALSNYFIASGQDMTRLTSLLEKTHE
jgi:outer membrane protein